MVMSLIYVILHKMYRDTRWHSWLRHCATSRKVAGSITDGAIGVLHLHNPPGRALGVESASNRNDHQDNFLGVKADILT